MFLEKGACPSLQERVLVVMLRHRHVYRITIFYSMFVNVLLHLPNLGFFFDTEGLSFRSPSV